MKSFIDDYLRNPSDAVLSARVASEKLCWCDSVDDEAIYSQISSGEFLLYTCIILD